MEHIYHQTPNLKKHTVCQLSYPCYSVIGKLLVGSLHHLVAIVIRVQSPVVVEGGAGSEDHLCVEAQGAQRVGLLQPVAPGPGLRILWDARGDRVGIVLITGLSREVN